MTPIDGSKLRALAKRRNSSLRQLASDLGYSYMGLWQIIDGRRGGSGRLFVALQKIGENPMDYIIQASPPAPAEGR